MFPPKNSSQRPAPPQAPGMMDPNDPTQQASPIAQAGMPMLTPSGGGMGGLGVPGIPPSTDGGMPMHPMMDLLGGMGGPPPLPPGGSMPQSGDAAGSPLLAALMGGWNPAAGGDIDLQGIGPADPQDGMSPLIRMLGLSSLGVQPQSPAGRSGVPYSEPNFGSYPGP